MRMRELLWESWASAIAQRISTIMVAVLAAAMCLTTLLTVGRTASAEAQINDRLDAAGSRLLIVTDVRNQGLLSPGVLAVAASMNTVERAIGLTTPFDVTSGAVGEGGPRVAAWSLLGDQDAAVTLTGGRWPGPGEAIVAENATDVLGFDGPAGYLVFGGDEAPVVGSYVAREPFTQLDAGAVIGASRPSAAATTMYVVATTATDVAATQSQVLRLVAAPTPSDLSVQSPANLAELQRQVGADVGAFGRALLLLVLGAGAVLTGVVVLADVLIRRTDLGRRRALGATRRTVVALVTLRTVIAAAAGALTGAGLGALQAYRLGALAPWSFVAGTMVLTLLTATAAALVPALLAATRDPVRVLRTP